VKTLIVDNGDCTCVRCKAFNAVGPCCSSHRANLCHACYRRTHFVEICVEGCAECAAEGLDPLLAVNR
jgi:hypothetical protein